jgi:uncharacterized protein YdeI (YjbR/CyaY-like superfamily)
MTAFQLMHPRGWAKRIAVKNGRWSILVDVEKLRTADDLRRIRDVHSPAAEHFEPDPGSVKRGIREWILQTKKPETRAKRILETATRAA